MIAPQKGKPLILYLTSTSRSIGALLVQEIDGAERPVYYISRKVQGAEERYTPVERHCLALVFTAQKLCHYFLSFKIHCSLLSWSALTGRVARWLLALAEFKISCVAPLAIKCQALADLLAQFPSGQCEPVQEELPGDGFEALAAASTTWMLSFNGAVGGGAGGAGIVLTSTDGQHEYLAYKLSFPCSNNEAEYEALILGLLAAIAKEIKTLKIVGDSKFVILQTEGHYALKEPTLAPYRATVQKLVQRFDKVEVIHKPRSDNRFPDALAMLGAKVEFNEEKIAIEIVKKTEPSIADEVSKEQAVEEWQEKLIKQLATRQGDAPLSELAQFTMIGKKLYYRGPQGWLARCIGLQEAKARLCQIHDATCRENDISLYWRVQRQGYYGPSMKMDTAMILRNCERC